MLLYARKPGNAGFSLVEVMVALTIGLLTALVVSQVMQVAEARKRAAASGADTTVNATLGLYMIERDGRNAGYGLASVRDSIGCEIRLTHAGVPQPPLNLVPVMIGDGADGAPDTLRFLASQMERAAMPTRIAVDHPQQASRFMVESDLGMRVGDMIVAVPATIAGNWCSVFQATAIETNEVQHEAGESPWNQEGAASIFPASGYASGDYVINLGRFQDRTYRIANNALGMTDFDAQTNTPVEMDLYPHIVQLQAVYGKDTNDDGVVDAWNADMPADAAGWQSIRAVRVALVARSEQPETEIVTLDGTDAASTCASANPHPAAVCWRPDPNGNGVAINVSAGTPNWQRYRYRVMETTIPLRNAIWWQ